jgi:hypothetical protein
MPLAGNLMLIVPFPVTKNSFRGRLPEICRIARPGWKVVFGAQPETRLVDRRDLGDRAAARFMTIGTGPLDQDELLWSLPASPLSHRACCRR